MNHTTEVQAFLRAGNTLDDLRERYAVKATPGRQYPNLVSLKYSMVDSPMSERIVQECRGIVLDAADDWRCVARGFDKFFNYGEGLAADIDWNSAVVQEKLDGSLCMAYWYRRRFHVATSGTPDGAGSVGRGSNDTFAKLFWRTFDAQGLRSYELDPVWTYCFELCAPDNRVVVPHATASLTLLTTRSPESGQEVPPGWWTGRWPVVRQFPLQSVDEILATFDQLSPLQQEGYVVVDGQMRRIKVKHPGYVALAHLKDSMTDSAFLEVTRSGEIPELLSAFPELAERLTAMRATYDALVAEVEADYAELRAIPEQKAFALAATKTRCAPALFALRSGKAQSVREWLSICSLSTFERLMAGNA